jgi:hypothetical protein
MKLLAIELKGLELGAVVADERYENLRRLVEAGTFGPFAGESSEFDGLLATAIDRRSIAAEGDEPSVVDAEVGALLEALDNETVVLVVATGGEAAGRWYVLAAPGTVPTGETEIVQAGDLATLVADLLSREATAGDDDDDEALIRERFSGLGYIS